MMTVLQALQQGHRLLEDAGVGVPRLTAEVLLAHAVRQDRSWLYAHSTDELTELAWIHYGRYLHERMNGKPTQYITKIQEFYGRDFRVSPAVLIPRPETEHLVEAMISVLSPESVVVDVGTGSGAIAISLQLETRCRAIATDISGDALAMAAENAGRLGAPVCFVQCDLLAALRTQTVHAVVSNPPYVPSTHAELLQREVRDWEPEVALYAGERGMEIYERLVNEAQRVLRPGGWMALELGFGLVDSVRALLDSRWNSREVIPDLAGIPRVLRARWSSEPA